MWLLPLILAFLYFGIVLSVIDLETCRLPDPLVLSFAIAGVAGITLGLAGGSFTASDGWRALMGAGVLGLFYFVAFLAYPRGMGFGDVKLAPVLGALLASFGWDVFAVGAFAAFVWGGIVGIVVMVRARARKGVAVPFGPWMFVGALTGITVGPALASWYLELIGV